MQHISHKRDRNFTETYEVENLCPSVVQIAAPQLSRFWRGPSFNAAPPLSDSHLRQSVSFLCLPCGTPAENVADVTLEAVKVWDDQPSFEGLVDQNDARFDHPVDSEFFNKLRFDEKKFNLLFQSFKIYFWNWEKSSLIFSMLSGSKLLVGHPSTPSTLHLHVVMAAISYRYQVLYFHPQYPVSFLLTCQDARGRYFWGSSSRVWDEGLTEGFPSFPAPL